MVFIHFLKFFFSPFDFCCCNGSLHTGNLFRCQLFSVRCQMGWSIASASKLSEDVDNSEVGPMPPLLSRSVDTENWANFSEYCRGAHYLPAAAGSYWGVVAGAEEQGDRVPREQARHAPPLGLRLPRRWLSQEKRFCKVGTVLNIWIMIGTVETFTDLVAFFLLNLRM